MESRRDFLKKAAVAAAGLTIVPSKTIAGLGHKAPSDTMNIVGIGIGGKGHPNLVGMKTENIIGLCDIDWKYAKNCFEEFPDAKRYWDWRKMFDELGDQIDGVTKKPASMYRYAPTAASYMTTTSPSHSLWALTSSCSADTSHASTNPQPRPEPLAAQSSKNTGAKVPTEPETGHAMTSAEKRNSSSKKALTPTFLTLVRSKTTSKRPALRSKLPCATAALFKTLFL